VKRRGREERSLSDYYTIRRNRITDAVAFLGFAIGLMAAVALRWQILNVNFRHGNFARAVYDFAKMMLWWGLLGGVIGIGAGYIAGMSWERFHLRWRRRNEVAEHLARVAAAEAASRLADVEGPAAVGLPSTDAIGARGAGGEGIRYDTSGLSASDFIALATRVWPHRYDVLPTSAAIRRTRNIGAWDGTRLVGVLRMLTDGYLFTIIPEVMVDPAYRGRGIGRELMNRALALAPGGTLMIGATSDSVGFFQRLGCELAPMGFVMKRPAPEPATAG
jgi:GNAT superfamily N-acetyltransferase